jgi:hypothetical protein
MKAQVSRQQWPFFIAAGTFHKANNAKSYRVFFATNTAHVTSMLLRLLWAGQF